MNVDIKRKINLESNTSAKLWFTINFNGISLCLNREKMICSKFYADFNI